MKYTITILVFITAINSFAQKDCHPDCDITFEQLFQMRCPPFTKAASDNECYKKVTDKLLEFRNEDMSQFNFLRNIACTHAAGWVEINEGECNAGGPPPCCPVQHWTKNANSWNIFKAKMNIVYAKREKQIQEIYYGCVKNLKQECVSNFNSLQDKILICLEKLKADNAVYSQAVNEFNSIKSTFKSALGSVESGMQPAENLKSYNDNTVYPFMEKICNYQIKATNGTKKNSSKVIEGDRLLKEKKYSEAEVMYSEALKENPGDEYAKSQEIKARDLKERAQKQDAAKEEKAANKRAEEERVKAQNDAAFYEKQRQANAAQNSYNKQQSEIEASTIALSALWIGFYMFDAPRNNCYNTKGFNFSIGPKNSFISAPVYQNNVDLDYYSNNTEKSETESITSNINTLNFGLNTEFNYYSDALHVSVPLNGGFGLLLNSQYNFSYGAGLNLFFGAKNIKKFKLALCADYNWFDMSGYYYFSTSREASYNNLGYVLTSTESKEATFSNTAFKVGIRFQKNFNSKNYNTSSPFVFDLFYTMNNIEDLTSNLGLNNFVQETLPGIEFNLNKIGEFGLFGKVIFTAPLGQLDYVLKSGSIGESTQPFFEIGIKRDYSWFKKFK